MQHSMVRLHNRTATETSFDSPSGPVVITREQRQVPCPCNACYGRKARRRARRMTQHHFIMSFPK